LHNQDADQILTYYDTTYFNGRYKKKRRIKVHTRTPLLFRPSIWNVFELTKTCIGRTNNISEGWNNKFATLVRINHPNIGIFIEALQMSHSSASINIINYRVGAFCNNLGKDDRLNKFCESLLNYDILISLISVSYLTRIKKILVGFF